MECIANYSRLCTSLANIQRPGLIGIEGFTGSGKSYLADQLATDLKVLAVHMDHYVIGEDESLPYADRIDIPRFMSVVNASISRHSLALVEGICLREILRRSKVQVTLFVYLKKLAQNGLWHDGLHLEDYEGKGEITENHEEPHRSDFAYHATERPHEHADVVFERTESDG